MNLFRYVQARCFSSKRLAKAKLYSNKGKTKVRSKPELEVSSNTEVAYGYLVGRKLHETY